MKKIKSFILNLFLGKKIFQPLFEFMHFFALKGMNYDRGHIVGSSGEVWIMSFLNKRFNNQAPVFFDVGANKGQFASDLLRRFNGPCTVHSFEPSGTAYNSLLLVIDERMRSHNFGFSDKISEARLFTNNDATPWASLYEVRHQYGRHSIHLQESETIKLDTIDNFCKEYDVPKINFLKIDVEGHEVAVLKGASDKLNSNSIDLIQFEFGLASMGSRTLLKDFYELLPNYNIYRIVQNGIHPVNYSERFEIYATTNYLAVNRQFVI